MCTRACVCLCIGGVTFQLLCCLFSVDITANELLRRVFPDDESKKESLRLSPERYCFNILLITSLSHGYHSDPADFVLKVAGRRSYIIGHNKLIDFAHIRR